jgi:hypothetical protein
MIAITTSTNYSNILPYVLAANRNFFDHWIFVTSEDDVKTQEILKKESNVTMLFFDFTKDNKKFNKGGGMKVGQEFAYANYPDSWYLCLDSDICLSSNFSINVDSLQSKEGIYGAVHRFDFNKLSDLNNMSNFFTYSSTDKKTQKCPLGFFQLYKEKRFYPTNLPTAGICDETFASPFKVKEYLNNFVCYHLGRDNKHWSGRKNYDDFIIDCDGLPSFLPSTPPTQSQTTKQNLKKQPQTPPSPKPQPQPQPQPKPSVPVPQEHPTKVERRKTPFNSNSRQHREYLRSLRRTNR